MLYAFLDESGDLGKFGSKYFIIVALILEDTWSLAVIMKKLRQRKLKKSIKSLSEIKANNSTRLVRKYVLKKLANTNCEILALVVDKNRLNHGYFREKHDFYNKLCGALLRKINVKNKASIVITVDRKETNALLRKDFDDYMRETLGINAPVLVFHKFSHESKELQVADFVAWAINRKFNSNDDYYYNLIKTKLPEKNFSLIE